MSSAAVTVAMAGATASASESGPNLGEMVKSLLHELSVLPAFGGEQLKGLAPAQALVMTNYTFFLLVALVLTMLFFTIASRRVSLVPKGISNAAEALVEFVRDSICVDVIGPEGAKYFPFIGTVFFFILFNNLVGLIPGSKPGTGTFSVTLTWGLFVFILYTTIGIRKHGLWKYLKSFLPSGVPKVLAPLVYVLELLSNLIRPLTLAIRLFANMFAGHIILGIFAIFVVAAVEAQQAIGLLTGTLSWVMIVIMFAFELFVAFIQAYVFSILTAVYIAGAEHAGEH
jgi:F-type H+-transporting ATPase subunit a